jgi:PAS domain S-box-containing protein
MRPVLDQEPLHAPHHLRAEAEVQLANAPQPSAVEELVHELRVHQIELEIQNENMQAVLSVLEESRDRFADLYDFAPTGYLTLSDQGLIADINLPGAALLGLDRGKLVQNPFARFVTPEDADRWHLYFTSVLKQRNKLECELVLQRGDGRRFEAQLDSLCLQKDGQAPMVRVALTDITARKQVEEELKRSNAELEQFSYGISHDLRQPLRMITSYLQLLEKSLADHLDDEQREYLHFVTDGARRLDQMLLDLLEYSRIGHNGEPPAWIESRAVLDEAMLYLRPAIAEAQANIRIHCDWPRIFVSPDEMLRLVQNLIGNAIKYRVAGRTPDIVVTSELIDKSWRFSVADNGVGILPDQIGRLFQVFQRLQSRTDYEGTGIGLALCRKIAEHHGGRIWAESAGKNQGSTFCVELPLTLTASGVQLPMLPA